MKNVVTDSGLAAWFAYGIQIELAIPSDIIYTLNDEKWLNFTQQRWPQFLDFIQSKRSKYQQLRQKIEKNDSTL